MSSSVDVTVEVDIDDVISSMTYKEKQELYDDLAEELGEEPAPELESNYGIEDFFRNMTPYEQKKVLCNALGVASYLDTEVLRAKLEPIITA